ncbi:MAG: hypothetical protein FWC98_02540 [Bacteroidales bacterium]|nr:hypothetical protein [Bacteroidales bacterium]
MKKIIFTICFVSLFSTITRAELTRVDGNSLSFGIGVGGWQWWHNEDSIGAGSVHFPSVHVRYERGILQVENVGVLSVGGQFGFRHSYYNGRFEGTFATMQYKHSWTSFYLLPSATLYFHEVFRNLWNLDENIELYGGFGLGIRYIYHRSSQGPAPPQHLPDVKQPWFGWNAFLGGRYCFSPNFAVFAEFGVGLSFFNFGATIGF